ncbi:MAG: hypothetical protein ABJ015_29800, partial [Rhodopirellula bahusiensis]
MKNAQIRLCTALIVSALLCVTRTPSSADAADVNVVIHRTTGRMEVKLDPQAKTNADGKLLVGKTKVLQIEVSGMQSGTFSTKLNNTDLPNPPITADGAFSVELSKEGTSLLSFIYEPATASPNNKESNATLRVELDLTGPRVRRAEIVELPSLGTTLLLSLDEDDFELPGTTAQAFAVERQNKDGAFESSGSPNSPIGEGRTIRLPFASLLPGEYKLKIDLSGLRDKAGNEAIGDTDWRFSVPPGRKFGQHVAFTPFAPPQKQTIPDEGFNPGDFVETRVARLYYFRDAHRVAQIINRNIRS